MDIYALRKLAGKEEIDYQFLLSALRDYSNPRDKISSWLQSGDLLRIKKGLYVFGNRVAISPYSPEVLANLIYGPSAISLTYALAFYGMIPERVSVITSITPKRNKHFSTPVGQFTYAYLTNFKYAEGIELLKNPQNQHFLIASPEKALCDQIALADKHITLTSPKNVELYLLEDLRMDEYNLTKLNCEKVNELSVIYRNKNINMLLQYLQKMRK